MKMQEVIMRLRGIAPVVAVNVEAASGTFSQLKLVISDALRANSVESVRALLKACDEKATQIDLALKSASDSAAMLKDLNESYKERLGPRAKKPKDDPRQMGLFDGDCSTTGVYDPNTEVRQ